jgi:ABC-type lipoprotein export system ATPase subunit
MTDALTATGLTKAYDGRTILDGVDLAVPAGAAVAIRGTSGTGKSTLLHLLGLLDTADAGTVAIGGVAATTADQRAALRARRIGTIFQAFHLLADFSVRENIVLPARVARVPVDHDRVTGLLTRLGLTDRAEARVDRLSGGERQRVAVARALLLRPAVVLADEPTGNLDPATAATVLTQLLSFVRDDGAALVVVTHDLAVASRCDRVLQLDAGRLGPAAQA